MDDDAAGEVVTLMAAFYNEAMQEVGLSEVMRTKIALSVAMKMLDDVDLSSLGKLS